MKFINYLEKISGISIYPLISLLVFFLFFGLLLLFVLRTKKHHFREVEQLPLDKN